MDIHGFFKSWAIFFWKKFEKSEISDFFGWGFFWETDKSRGFRLNIVLRGIVGIILGGRCKYIGIVRPRGNFSPMRGRDWAGVKGWSGRSFQEGRGWCSAFRDAGLFIRVREDMGKSWEESRPSRFTSEAPMPGNSQLPMIFQSTYEKKRGDYERGGRVFRTWGRGTQGVNTTSDLIR